VSSLKTPHPRTPGQGELAHTLVLTVKTQKLEIVYFWKFDTKFGSKSIKLILGRTIKNPNKVEEPIPNTLRFRTTKEYELDMNFFSK
jgi:hypothetical protein